MPSLVGAGACSLSTMPLAAAPRRCIFRRRSGVVDVHARQQRSGARGLEQKPRDRRSSAATRLNQLRLLGPAAHVPSPHRRFQNRPALCEAQLRRCRDHRGSGRRRAGPFAFGELAPSSSAISAAPAWSLRRRCRAGPAHRSGRARSISAFEHHNLAGIALARTLWLQGYPAQAVERARQSDQGCRSEMDHPVSLSHRVDLGDRGVLVEPAIFASAEEHIGLADLARRIPIARPLSCCRPGLQRGAGHPPRRCRRAGSRACKDALEELHAARYEVLTTALQHLACSRTWRRLGRFAEGMTLIDETIETGRDKRRPLYMPELLRVKGSILLAMPQPQHDDAGRLLHAVA